MITSEQFQDIETYYTRRETIDAMLPFVINREIAFIPAKFDSDNKPLRSCQAHKFESLLFLANYMRYVTKQRPYNWYVSLAKFNTPPPKVSLSYAMRFNRREQIREWEKNLPEKIDYYDLVIDVDAPDHTEVSIQSAVDSTKAIRDQLHKENAKFFIVFSGMGFHIYIKQEQNNQNYDGYTQPNIYQSHLKYAEYLKKTFSELIDTKIYDSRRVIKLPYSVAIYEHGLFFCRPIDNGELNNFDIEKYRFKLTNMNYRKPYIYNETKG